MSVFSYLSELMIPVTIFYIITYGLMEKVNVYDEFVSSFGNNFCEIRNGKYYIDLKATVKNQLAEMGIPESNIAVSDLCTYCNNELYSYRREGAKAGRMAAFIKTPK